MRTFWRITRLLGDYKWLTITGFTLAFAQMGLSLVVPWWAATPVCSRGTGSP